MKENKLPITVLVITKNEESHLERCLDSLSAFSEVMVIDSYSEDLTKNIAKNNNFKVVDFFWNNSYPKKRQWCLDTINIGHDWVLWIDADEVVTAGFIEELTFITKINQPYCGYFISSSYIWNGRTLRYGFKNNKLSFYNRSMIVFPVVDDLDLEGMGEVEGHYQPVKVDKYVDKKIGQIKSRILHYAGEDRHRWVERHKNYARWEAGMIKRDAYPKDPVFWRQWLKSLMRRSVFKPWAMFFYSYVFRLGFLDGSAGFDFALSRKFYCDLVLKELRSL
ncbi:MAG: glycosyltransferase family 2 protein [Alphaproteobacteria bacterium]